MGRADLKFGVTNELRDILLSDSALRELVGDKVYPLVASEGTEGDFILYQRDQYRITRNKMGYTEQSAYVFINAVSRSYDRSQQIAARVFELLDGSRWKNPDMEIYLEDSSEDYGDGKFVQIMLFKVI